MSERDLLRVSAGCRHALPGECAVRFADRRRERRLSAVRGNGHACGPDVRRPRSRRCSGSSGSASTSTGCPRSSPGGSAARVAIARAMAARPAPRCCLDDPDRPGSNPITAAIGRRRDRQAARPPPRDVDRRDPQIRDAVYVATHQASRDNGALRIVAVPEAEATHARFMVLHHGNCFEGTVAELRASATRSSRSSS